MLRTDDAGKPFENRLPTLEQAESKRFGRERVAVAVDDDAGNPVAFGVDHPIGVGDVIQFENVAPQSRTRR